MDSCLVVISHYNAWPTDQLIALLDQIHAVPSGHPFECLIVVNQAEPKDLVLPERYATVRVLTRENLGYNIGAWDHGWRESPGFANYLFLQEECQIVRPGWLKAFVDVASKPGVGLVGESVNWQNLGWGRIQAYSKDQPFPDSPMDGRFVGFAEGIKLSLERLGIPPGPKAEHLQSLILFASRKVLEAIDGFPIGQSYGEAVVTEVAITKRVEAIGLKARTVGLGYFRFILHPQWKFRQATVARVAFSTLFWKLEPLIPVPVGYWIRNAPSYLKRQMARRAPTIPEVTLQAESTDPNR